MRWEWAVVIAMLASTVHAADGHLEGRVLDSVTHAGLDGVGVTLYGRSGTKLLADTDEQGQFAIDGIADGEYRVELRYQGYGITAPGTDRLFPIGGYTPKSWIVTVAGGKGSFAGELTPFPRMVGRVIDPADKPVQAAWVTLASPGSTQSFPTDRNGRFEPIGYFLPGTYTVSVMPPISMPPPPAAADGTLLAWTRLWYPGVFQRGLASQFTIRAGETVEVELKLKPAPARPVHGTVLLPDGNPAEGIEVAAGEGIEARWRTKTRAGGAFELAAVPEGTWSLHAGDELKARARVTVAEKPVDVKLYLAAPVGVRGRVVVAGREGVPLPKLIVVSLRAFEAVESIASGAAEADGSFHIEGLYPGAYTVEIRPELPPPFYVDTIRIGGLPVPKIDVLGEVADLTITLKNDAGRVQGKFPGCGVVSAVQLVPSEPAMRISPYAQMTLCSGDRYRFASVRPGNYQVFPGGAVVAVRAGETTILDLN
ncbi:MAG TPA: carboxypeptidase regulatory-like domain-containing protein [Candidatus Limnocylindrales bacterium]|nr:carboxypeptidase regulatory-like domain-containing protein [Candidatus Limnocylindrales bacterium]